jgi:aspartate racemase
VLGVLGGMGPLATVDFLKKLVQATGGASDQRHIPTVTWSVPQIPDRSNYIINGSESPFPALRRGVLSLQSMGASVVVMPCNTAHFWYEQLTESTGMKILHIADAVIDQLQKIPTSLEKEKTVGVIGTTGTIRSAIYQKKLKTASWNALVPDDADQRTVMTGIAMAKAGKIKIAQEIFQQQIDKLKAQGAQVIVLGCTELPAVLDAAPNLIDSNLALANRCVRWFEATYNGYETITDNNMPYAVSQDRPSNEFNGGIC